MIEGKAINKKANVFKKLLERFHEPHYSWWTAVAVGDTVTTIETLLHQIPLPEILEHHIALFAQIQSELGRMQKLLNSAPIDPPDLAKLEELFCGIIQYLEIESIS